MRNWMLRLRHAVAATAVLACLCAAPAASAVEPDEASRAQARDALAEAEALIEGRGARTGRELTPVLLELARNLGLDVVAEGVEDEDVLDHLRTLHCHEAQGFHFSRALPAEALVGWLAEWRSAVPQPA